MHLFAVWGWKGEQERIEIFSFQKKRSLLIRRRMCWKFDAIVRIVSAADFCAHRTCYRATNTRRYRHRLLSCENTRYSTEVIGEKIQTKKIYPTTDERTPTKSAEKTEKFLFWKVELWVRMLFMHVVRSRSIK